MRKISKISAAKPATKPAAAVAAKPVTPASGTAKPERAAIIEAARVYVAKLYNGASLAVHSKRPCTAAAYASHIAKPVQQCGASGASTRDESLLSLIASKSDAKSGAFDPVSIAADLGIISRLASVGYLTMRGDACTLTDTGAERARIVAKRAA